MMRRPRWHVGLLALLAQMVLLSVHRSAWAASAATGFDPLFSLCLASQPATRPELLWSSWSLAPEVVLPLLLVLTLYGGGLMASQAWPDRPAVRPWQVACFAAGWLALVVALVSPLCRMAATLASAHMVQHVVLVAVAPPLLMLGAPMAVMAAALPRQWHDALVGRARRLPANVTGRRLGSPLSAAALYGAAIWLWHVPLFYQAALLSEALHLLQYAVLIATGLLYWRALIATATRDPEGHGGAIVASVVTTIHTGLLGALLTFAPAPWYPLIAARAATWGLTPLQDQQLAGLIMWVPMGFIYLISSVCLAAVWLKAIERSGKRRLPV